MKRHGKRCTQVDARTGKRCRNFCDVTYRLCPRHAAQVCHKFREEERLDLEALHLTKASP